MQLFSYIFSLCIKRESLFAKLKCPPLLSFNDFNIDSVLYLKKYQNFYKTLCLQKSRGIPILILKCASLGGRDTSCMYRVHRCIAACVDRQMRDTPAWPLSSGTAQIMQRCIGSRGPYGGGAFISLVVIGARGSTSPPLLLSLRVQHPVTLSRVHPVVCVFIYRALPLLYRGEGSRCTIRQLRFVRSACLTHLILSRECAIPFLAYLKGAYGILAW